MNDLTKESKLKQLQQIKEYLSRNWHGISDSFVDRLIARVQYDKLLEELKN